MTTKSTKPTKYLTAFIDDDGGQDVVEYSLLLVLIGTVILIYLTGMGTNVTSIFSKVSLKLNQVNQSIQ